MSTCMIPRMALSLAIVFLMAGCGSMQASATDASEVSQIKKLPAKDEPFLTMGMPNSYTLSVSKVKVPNFEQVLQNRAQIFCRSKGDRWIAGPVLGKVYDINRSPGNAYHDFSCFESKEQMRVLFNQKEYRENQERERLIALQKQGEDERRAYREEMRKERTKSDLSSDSRSHRQQTPRRNSAHENLCRTLAYEATQGRVDPYLYRCNLSAKEKEIICRTAYIEASLTGSSANIPRFCY